MPDTYMPPVERKPLESPFPGLGRTPIAEMADSRVGVYILKDIDPPQAGVPWRWTQKKPTLRFHIVDLSLRKLTADLAVPETTFQQTGAVTILWTVNGHPLEAVRYDTSGQKHYEKLVPSEWIDPMKDTIVSAEIDKLYTTPKDPNALPTSVAASDAGRTFGFILTRVGFTR